MSRQKEQQLACCEEREFARRLSEMPIEQQTEAIRIRNEIKYISRFPSGPLIAAKVRWPSSSTPAKPRSARSNFSRSY